MEYVLQDRKNAIISTKSGFTQFANMVFREEIKRKGYTTFKDWYWKIIQSLVNNNIGKTSPLTCPKKNYWGIRLVQFKTRLMVN